MESDLGELAAAGLAGILINTTNLFTGRLFIQSVPGGELIWRNL